MRLRELKEAAHQLFVRGKFSQCAQTYQQVLRLEPRDPNMHVRHAEACRRAGDRQQAIASYRTAAELLLELGCEIRARGALKAALELDPRNQFLQEAVTQLGPQHEEPFSPGISEGRDELPPLECGLDPAPLPPAAPRAKRAAGTEEPSRAAALPPIHRMLPAAQSSPPPGPPVLLPAPVHSLASLPQLVAAPLPPRSATAGTRAQTVRPAVPPVLTALPVTAGIQAPTVPAPSCASGPRLEVRHLSPSALAFRASPQDGWIVIRSHTPLELHVVEDLEKLPPMMQDLPAELTVASPAEAASSTVH